MLTARKQMLPEHWPGGPPPMQRHFRSSLAWRMCLVAEGRFDAMLTFRRAFEWDIAAGALIAAEAGARVTDGHGAELRFNSARRGAGRRRSRPPRRCIGGSWRTACREPARREV